MAYDDDRDVILEADRHAKGVGRISLRIGGTEYAAVENGGTGTGLLAPLADGAVTTAKIAAAAVTAAKLADPGTGKVYGSNGSGAAAAVFPPGRELGYVEFTSNATSTATVEASADTVVSLGAIVFDGSPVIFQFQAVSWTTSSNSNTGTSLVLFEDGSSVGTIRRANVGTSARGELAVTMRYTPSAGSHTYSVRCFQAVTGASTVTITAGAGGAGTDRPGSLRVSRA